MSRFPEVEELAEDQALARLQAAIARNLRVFEVLLHRCNEGIALVTPEMTLLRLVHPLMSYHSSEILGASFLSYVHPDDAASVSTAFAQLLAGEKQTTVCECRALENDGTWRWIEMQMTDLLDDPDIAAILFNYRNITCRKQYQETAQRLAAYLACPEYAMFTEDLDGVILDWNAGAERAFGYSAGEIVGQNVAVLIPANLLDREIATRALVVQGQEVPEYRATRLRRDGMAIPMRVKLSAIGLHPVRGIAQIACVTEAAM
jgi:PAS domain S-box-containing protein